MKNKLLKLSFFWCFMLFFKIGAIASSFENKIDSMRLLADTTQSTYNRGLQFNRIAVEFIQVDSDSVYVYAKKASAVAADLEDTLMHSIACVNAGIAAYFNGDFVASLSYYEEAANIYRKIADEERLGQTLNNMGLIYSELDETAKARELLLESLALQEKLNDVSAIITLYINLSLIADGQEETIDFLLKALRIAKANEVFGAVTHISNNLSNNWSEKKQHDSAYHYLTYALEYASSPFDSINSIFSKGFYLLNVGEYEAAVASFEQSLTASKEVQYQHLIAKNYKGLERAYSGMGAYSAALKYAQKRESLIAEQRSKENIQQIAEIEKRHRFQQLQAAMKEDEMRQQQQFQQKERKSNLITLITIAVIVFLFAVFIFIIRRQFLETKLIKDLEALNKTIVEQKNSLESANQRLKVFNDYKSHLFLALSQLLQNPMAKLKSALVTLTEKQFQQNEVKSFVRPLNNQVIQVSVFLQSLLQWSKLQLGEDSQNKRESNFLPEAVLREIAFSFGKVAAIKKADFRYEMPDFQPICFSLPYFRAIFTNLMGTALHFCDQNSEIWIKADKNADAYRIHILFETTNLNSHQLDALQKPVLKLNDENLEKVGIETGFFITDEVVQSLPAEWAIDCQDGKCCLKVYPFLRPF